MVELGGRSLGGPCSQDVVVQSIAIQSGAMVGQEAAMPAATPAIPCLAHELDKIMSCPRLLLVMRCVWDDGQKPSPMIQSVQVRAVRR